MLDTGTSRLRTIAVRTAIRSATVGGVIEGGRSVRQCFTMALRRRFDRKPKCRIFTKPLGRTCNKNRRMNSMASSDISLIWLHPGNLASGNVRSRFPGLTTVHWKWPLGGYIAPDTAGPDPVRRGVGIGPLIPVCRTARKPRRAPSCLGSAPISSRDLLPEIGFHRRLAGFVTPAAPILAGG